MSHFIDGNWMDGDGEAFTSIDPATGDAVWTGRAAGPADVDRAVRAARDASPRWASLTVAERGEHLQRFAEQLKTHRVELAELISREMGKPRWESLLEVDGMIAKVPISLDAIGRRRSDTAGESPLGRTATRYKPHGVVAVFGPFNFPGHLPNGHIVPALLAGNTVVFKPSERTPGVGQKTLKLWHAAGMPPGVINLVQGARETGIALTGHDGVDGVFFTGSVVAGKALNRALADRPDKILALELGGNAPLVVHASANPMAAAYLAIQSAFVTSGQRCSCARRLIVPRGPGGDALLRRLVEMTRSIVVGAFTQSPEPFMGPLISDEAATGVLRAQASLIRRGGRPFLETRSIGQRAAFLSPGIIDVTGIDLPDKEVFGPLLSVIRVADFAAAIDEANRTRFGLAAALLGGTRDDFDLFYRHIRAGVVNWNRATTAAASTLPFGGVGLSGNHRPSAYFAADYCSYAVASIEDETLRMPATLTPGLLTSPGISREG